jgi:hypothetical protein
MPIPVTCPECQYHFLVGEEFAGRPGRCPECAAIIHVPGPDLRPLPASYEPPDPSPYRTSRADDAFDDFPSRLRRRRRDDDGDRYERDQRDDYDDRERDRALADQPPTFDAHARARKWASVAGGLRNLMVAVVLIAIAQVVTSAFDLVEPIQPGQQNALRPRDKAMLIGNLVFFVLAMLLWAYGRIGCGRCPYVPARRVALPAGVIAGLTAVLGACAFGAIVVGVFLVAQNPVGPGAALLLLGVCAFFPAFVGFLVAELMGLVSQVKMATGLRDAAFARASRLQIVVALILTGLSMAGVCVLFVFMMGEMQKAQKKQEDEQRQQQHAQQPPAENADAAPPGPKGKGIAKPKGPAPVNNGQAGQQPPPEFDWGEHPGAVYAMVIGRLFIFLTYAVVSVVCFQLGRRAVRREIDHLVGDPHDRDQPRDEHY